MSLLKIYPVHHHMDAEKELWINPHHVIAVIPCSPNGPEISNAQIVMSKKGVYYSVLDEASTIAAQIDTAMRS